MSILSSRFLIVFVTALTASSALAHADDSDMTFLHLYRVSKFFEPGYYRGVTASGDKCSVMVSLKSLSNGEVYEVFMSGDVTSTGVSVSSAISMDEIYSFDFQGMYEKRFLWIKLKHKFSNFGGTYTSADNVRAEKDESGKVHTIFLDQTIIENPTGGGLGDYKQLQCGNLIHSPFAR